MNEEMENFIGLSAVLTGFDSSILAPELDPVDIKSEYLPFFTAKIGQPLLSNLLQQYAKLSGEGLTAQQIGEAMLAPANGADFVLACRQLIFMWYSGAWPILIPASATAPASTVSDLISGNTYAAALVWQVMQSHAMGDSNYRYGYWAKPPAALDEYTGQQGA
ncbi:MAG TPA: hypothetical protein VGO76_08015 [Luteibacter sp.]|jgi:hypothetical protein|nr:hypothetical protein [Luteibacter sp.]